MEDLRDKLANPKVANLSVTSTYSIDRAVTQDLYDAIIAGTYNIPAGMMLIMKNVAAVSVRMGNGGKWIDALQISGATTVSPTFTGIPAAPTASVGTNTTQVATTAFVLANAGKSKTQINALVSPASTYADLAAATAAIKSVIDALKA